MFSEIIPKYKYWVADYPNLHPWFEGFPIPETYGVKSNVTPVCIDTTTLKYKLAKRAIYSIDSVSADGFDLAITDDYEEDLTNAEFTIYGMPKLTKDTTYYFLVEGDWTVNGSDYVEIAGDSSGTYADGQKYNIDSVDSWTGFSGVDLCFRVYGKNSIEGEEELKQVEIQSPGHNVVPHESLQPTHVLLLLDVKDYLTSLI